MQIDVIKDRGVMVRENTQGLLENSYNLSISNASDKTQIVTAEVSGLEDIHITGMPPKGIVVPAGQLVSAPVQVNVPPEYAEKGSHPIVFTFRYRYEGQPETEVREIKEKSIFIGE